MATAPRLQSESTLTDRYQTTVPSTVRKALGLNKQDKIRYTIQPDGKVLLSRVEQPAEDSVLKHFLDFLAQDIERNPQNVKAISPSLVRRIQSLVADIDLDLDLDAPLSDEDE